MNAVVIPIIPSIAIRRILYPTDFSPASKAALPVVAAVARRYRSEVYVANVRSALPYTMPTPEAVCSIENKREREARSEMNSIVHSPEMKDLAVSVIAETGDPAEELMRMVRDYDIDLAVVGTHGRTGMMRLLMGSLAEELFRNLQCPVLTVGPHLAKRHVAPGEIKTILCPTDLSSDSRAVFPLVASLALEYKARIVLLHTIAVHNALSSIALETASLARREILRMFVPEIDPRCEYEIIVDFGDPAERILCCASECHADLIAFGVRQAGEASTHFRNTVAYKVILEAECPVLTSR